MIGNSNDATNFSNKLLLTKRPAVNFCKAFTNNLSINIKSLKTQLTKIIQ